MNILKKISIPFSGGLILGIIATLGLGRELRGYDQSLRNIDLTKYESIIKYTGVWIINEDKNGLSCRNSHRELNYLLVESMLSAASVRVRWGELFWFRDKFSLVNSKNLSVQHCSLYRILSLAKENNEEVLVFTYLDDTPEDTYGFTNIMHYKKAVYYCIDPQTSEVLTDENGNYIFYFVDQRYEKPNCEDRGARENTRFFSLLGFFKYLDKNKDRIERTILIGHRAELDGF